MMFDHTKEIVMHKVYNIYGFRVIDYSLKILMSAIQMTLDQSDMSVTVPDNEFAGALVKHGIIKPKYDSEYVAGDKFKEFVEEVRLSA